MNCKYYQELRNKCGLYKGRACINNCFAKSPLNASVSGIFGVDEARKEIMCLCPKTSVK